ncbi:MULTISPECIES: FapA family protein [Bacillus]|uniref:FapA family protein n=1 Tax=Bacillus TaxID=1386 RepID=UPI000BB97E04|nr:MULTISPECIES: FapA family protein [Bacillus]
MQTILSSGKNVTTAIKDGLVLLGVTMQEVEIEVVDYGKKGMLGFGGKKAVVKITKKSPVDKLDKEKKEQLDTEGLVDRYFEEIEENQEIPQKDLTENTPTFSETPVKQEVKKSGKVWVVDGELHYELGEDRFPTVVVTPPVKIYKNNESTSEEQLIITGKDKVKLLVEDEVIKSHWKAYMDEQKLNVYLEITPGYKINRKIVDVAPEFDIKITASEEKIKYNDLSYAEVLSKLEALRVKQGFKHSEINKAIETLEPGLFIIASGLKPKEGKNGWVEVKVDVEPVTGPVEKKDGTVDFKEMKRIPTVERGKIIAIVHDPIPGEVGYTVTNEPLLAKQTIPVHLKTAKGTVLHEEKVIASDSGRPFIEKRGQYVTTSILSKLTHKGNVNLASGNIRFTGDVEILGEIEDGMKVEADGDITVEKTINSSQVSASGGIIAYSNVVGSELSAGKNNMLIAELGHLIGLIHSNVEKIISLIKQLSKSPAFKSNDLTSVGLQPLINILLEKKFKGFKPLVKKYVDVVKRGEDFLVDDSWRQVAVTLSQIFLSLSKERMTIDALIMLSEKMKVLYEISKAPVEPDSYITISSALNSKLYCSGNVLILGQSCVNTKIHAGGTLKISGILRGGEVYGRLGVELNEVGATMGTTTLVAVPNDQVIKIKNAMEGTIIKIGNAKYTFKDTKRHVKARLNEEEQIMFE